MTRADYSRLVLFDIDGTLLLTAGAGRRAITEALSDEVADPAAFAGIRDLLQRHARFGPKIQGVTQTRDKMSRAHALSVPVQNGAFRLQGRNASQVHAGQQELFDEMTTFPFGEHDDLLDATATGAAYLLDRPEPRIW